MRRKAEGFSYVEVVVSMAVLLIVSGMVYQSMVVARRLQNQASTKIEVAHQSESMIGQVIATLREKGLPVQKQSSLWAYMEHATYNQEWLDQMYDTQDYDYHVALIPWGCGQTKFQTSQLSKGIYLTTSGEDTESSFKQLLGAEELTFEKTTESILKPMGKAYGKLSITQFNGGTQPSIYGIRLEEVLVNVVYKGMINGEIHYEISAGEIGDSLINKANHAYIPLQIEVDLRQVQTPPIIMPKLVFANKTSFPVSIKIMIPEEITSVDAVAVAQEDKGHVTLENYKEPQTPLHMVFVVVTKKGAVPWQVVEKQMVMMATPS